MINTKYTHPIILKHRLFQIALRACLLVSVVFLLLSCSDIHRDDPSLVTIKFRYETSIPAQVQLAWGVDGWKLADDVFRPTGTYIENEVMHTPMTRQGDASVVNISIPKGTEIRYGFWVSADRYANPKHYWDGNREIYQVKAKADEEIIVKSSLFNTSTLNNPEYASQYPESAFPSTRNLLLVPTVATGLAKPILIIILTLLAILITAAALRKISTLSLVLLIILIIGATLRLQWVEQPYIDAFSWRQTSTAMMAENYFKTNGNILYPEVNWTGPGPNYQGREFQTVSYLASFFYRIFGQQDWIGRSVAIAFGVWGIFALYNLVALSWDRNVAVVTAAIMAILPASIFVERAFLPDPAMVALMTTSLWFFVKYLKSDRFIFLILAGLAGMLGALTKLPGLIIGLPALYALVVFLPRKPKPVRRLIIICTTGILVLVPVVLYYLWARRLAIIYPPHHFAGGGNWLWNAQIDTWLSRNYFLTELFWLSTNWLWTFPVLILTLIGVGFLLFAWWVGNQHEAPILNYELPMIFYWWLIASAFYYIIGAKELVTNSWNLHIITPAVAALSALGIVVILRVANQRRWKPITVAIIIGVLIVIWGIGFNNNLRKLYTSKAYDDYLLGMKLQELSEPGDLIVTINDTLGNPTTIYYSKRRGWIYPPPSPHGAWTDLLNDENNAIQKMESLRSEGADWLGFDIDRKKQFWQDYPQLAAYIEKSSHLVEKNDEYVIFRFNDTSD